eukprot:s105_g6.t1
MAINKQRLEKIKARQEVMHKVSADAQEAITKEPEVGWAHAVTRLVRERAQELQKADVGKKFITQLLLQGMLMLLESEVVVKCRQADQAVVQQCLKDMQVLLARQACKLTIDTSFLPPAPTQTLRMALHASAEWCSRAKAGEEPRAPGYRTTPLTQDSAWSWSKRSQPSVACFSRRSSSVDDQLNRFAAQECPASETWRPSWPAVLLLRASEAVESLDRMEVDCDFMRCKIKLSCKQQESERKKRSEPEKMRIKRPRKSALNAQIRDLATWTRPERQTLLLSRAWGPELQELASELCLPGGEPVTIQKSGS